MADIGFTKADMLFLLALTVNLDYSIRRKIGLSLNPPLMTDEVPNPPLAPALPADGLGSENRGIARGTPPPPIMLAVDTEIYDESERETVC